MKRQFQAFTYKVVNQAQETLDVFIDGIIVDAETQQILKDWFGGETSVSYKSFRDQVLDAKPKTINVYVNSGGGMVTDAMAIRDFLASQESAGITVNRIGRGVIASAATFILMGKNSVMSENSWFMIHNVSGGVYGDLVMMENYVRTARKFNDQAAEVYAKATGLSATVIGNMMDKETWMPASEAKEKGFVNAIEGTASFSNKIAPENWPFENKAILNSYNAAVKEPVVEEPAIEDSKTFFSNLNNHFMKFLDKLKASITNIKADPEFKKVENGDAIVNAIEKYFAPFAQEMDAAAEKKDDKPADEVTPPVEDKKEEKPPIEEKKEEKEEKPVEDPALTAANAKILKLEGEMAAIRASLAGKASLPDEDDNKKVPKAFNKAKIEYEK